MIRCPQQNCRALAEVVELNLSNELIPVEGRCLVCRHQWILEPEEASNLYDEYVRLRKEVDEMFVIYNPREGSFRNPKPVNAGTLTRMKELAKALSTEHKHNLDISASEWYEIDKDAL